ncbi:hypothetical protein Pcinc_036125 [Petrolisthes cinctipes]|uniref:Membrane protein BRI3 n=1 Tax=Petrolisthes cinctipes TaxID=88211 RepID=A0AAE1BYE9_PETCI|nr:hypothetical protein Pcinc_036125 [Petrolisthes cinctipes]
MDQQTPATTYSKVEPPPPYSANTQAAPIGFSQASPPPPFTQQQPMGPPPLQQQQQPVSVTVYQPEPVTTTNVVVMAPTCPACQRGILTSEFTCCGICLGIWLFPLGLICCFLMRKTRCSNCRANYS